MIKKILGKFHKRSSSDEDINQKKNYINDEFFNGISSFSSDCGTTECKYSPNGKSNPVLSSDGFYDLNPCGDGEGVAMPAKYKRLGPKYGAKVGPVGEKLSYQSLPRFWQVPSPERVNLFIKKLNLCCVVYDFGNPIKHLKDKDVKRQTLLELVDFVELVSLRYDEVLVQEIVKMVSANLFRTFPVSFQDKRLLIDVYEGEEDEPFMEPSWPHLQVVYDFFLRFVSSKEMDVKVAKRYINHSFILRLLNLFDSEDKREREFLKAILHRIYAKFVVHRRALREEIKNIFYEFIFETEKHNGIAELLQIMGSIINGFDLPLKEEHKLLLNRAIIPLHKPKCVSMYHQHLCYCIMQFLKKDHRLAETVLSGLLKYWPITNSSKEVMFLDELEGILEATQAVEFQHCMVPLFSQIGRCVNSSQFQVAERALSIWNNDYIRNLILRNRHVTLPIILPHLERNSHSHWNRAVQNLAFKVKKIFSDDDQEFFDECSVRIQEDEIKEVAAKEKQALTWKRLEDVAASKVVNSEAVVHFRI